MLLAGIDRSQKKLRTIFEIEASTGTSTQADRLTRCNAGLEGKWGLERYCDERSDGREGEAHVLCVLGLHGGAPRYLLDRCYEGGFLRCRLGLFFAGKAGLADKYDAYDAQYNDKGLHIAFLPAVQAFILSALSSGSCVIFMPRSS